MITVITSKSMDGSVTRYLLGLILPLSQASHTQQVLTSQYTFPCNWKQWNHNCWRVDICPQYSTARKDAINGDNCRVDICCPQYSVLKYYATAIKEVTYPIIQVYNHYCRYVYRAVVCISKKLNSFKWCLLSPNSMLECCSNLLSSIL